MGRIGGDRCVALQLLEKHDLAPDMLRLGIEPLTSMLSSVEIPRLTEALQEFAPRLAELGGALFWPSAHVLGAEIDAADFAGASLELPALEAALGALAISTLLPPAMQRSVRRRQLGWIGGRLCAERALAALGRPHEGVPRGDGGQPIWPAGIVGSITHTNFAAHALVVRRANCAGVGIDSERLLDAAGHADVASLCCSSAERAAWLAGPDAALRATILFAAKESFYKAAYPAVRRFIDFDEVEAVAWDAATGTLVLRPNEGLATPGTLVTARYRIDTANDVHASIVLGEALAARLRTG